MPTANDDRRPGLGPGSPGTTSRYVAVGAVVAAVVVVGTLLFTGGRDAPPTQATAPATEAPSAPITPQPGNAGPGPTK